MEYTVKQLSDIAGVSARTLRYYDQIDLLKPRRSKSSGYRIYGPEEVDRLQQILFYRELGFSLEQISVAINSPDFDMRKALLDHRDRLLEQQVKLNNLITNVEKSIARVEGRTTMTDREKFAGFKHQLVRENERTYGKEVREKYGDQDVDTSNAKVLGMSEQDYAKSNVLAEQIIKTLIAAMETGDPGGKLGQKTAQLHREWLSRYWDNYSSEVHAGLAEMYVTDERFTKYYDQHKAGAAKFLRDAILVYTKQNNG